MKAVWQIRVVLVLLMLGGTAIFLQARRRAEATPNARELSTFPAAIGDLQSQDEVLTPDVLEVLGPGKFLERLYSNGRELPLDLFIAYFPSQKTGDTIHSPKNCLPGSGWMPVESSHVSIPITGRPTIVANRYIIAKGLSRQMVIYWYQAHGRTVASEYWAKFYLVADALRMNRTDGALVRIVTPMGDRERVQDASLRAVKFAQEIAPTLDPFIPR